MGEIFRMHGIPIVIAIDKDSKFSLNIWKGTFKGMGTKMNLSTNYYPQNDKKTRRVIEVLEYMLCMYVTDIK